MTPVSVIIPVFDCAAHLREAVESVLAQETQGVGEILLVDDGSTDGSAAVAEAFALSRPDLISVLRHPDRGNHGPGATRNLGIEAARSPLVCFLDGDDYWLPERLDGALRVLADAPDVDAVVDLSSYRFENEEDEALLRPLPLFPPDAFTWVSRDDFFDGFTSGRILWNVNSIVVRRAAFARCGLFGTSRLHQDTHLWLRMAASLAIRPSPTGRPVSVYRRHASNRYRPFSQQVEAGEQVSWSVVAQREYEYWRSLLVWGEEVGAIPGFLAYVSRRFAWAAGTVGAFREVGEVARRLGRPGLWAHAAMGPFRQFALTRVLRPLRRLLLRLRHGRRPVDPAS